MTPPINKNKFFLIVAFTRFGTPPLSTSQNKTAASAAMQQQQQKAAAAAAAGYFAVAAFRTCRHRSSSMLIEVGVFLLPLPPFLVVTT
jgi:Tfp pilus assembly ATPase PilU